MTEMRTENISLILMTLICLYSIILKIISLSGECFAQNSNVEI